MTSLSQHQVTIIGDTLSNDEYSSDDELIEYLSGEGIPLDVAVMAVTTIAPVLRTNPRADVQLVDGNIAIRIL